MLKDSHGWIQASDVIPMFPSLVWKMSLAPELRDAIEAKALAALEGLRRHLPALEAGHGWQSEQTLHERLARQRASFDFCESVPRSSR